MQRTKFDFPNQQGEQLAGMLELPDSPPSAYALFAHCFTCSKDIAAASRISRALADKGISVLRFDFTGLGNSDGDFANTNFSANVQDLVAASNHLAQQYQSPTILIGHSLGGAAVLAAAQQLPDVRAVATIGAPASAQHVKHLFTDKAAEIQAEGVAEVALAGRQFTIKRQFLDDLDNYSGTEHIGGLRKALLVMHAPMDQTVSVDEAAKIYAAAKHPKSFVSLDSADHLLSRREDSQYAADIIATWASRYVESVVGEKPSPNADPITPGHVRITEKNHAFTRGVQTSSHRLISDEPPAVGGENLGPNPYEYLLAALGTCTSMTIRMYANRKKLPLENIDIDLSHDRIHAQDCEQCESDGGMVDRITKVIRLQGDLSEQERTRLIEIADRCPVHKTLHNELLIDTVDDGA